MQTKRRAWWHCALHRLSCCSPAFKTCLESHRATSEVICRAQGFMPHGYQRQPGLCLIKPPQSTKTQRTCWFTWKESDRGTPWKRNSLISQNSSDALRASWENLLEEEHGRSRSEVHLHKCCPLGTFTIWRKGTIQQRSQWPFTSLLHMTPIKWLIFFQPFTSFDLSILNSLTTY